MTIQELQTKRETLIIQIKVIKDDLREYTKFPVDTVDVEQIKYQYSYILREIRTYINLNFMQPVVQNWIYRRNYFELRMQTID